MRRALHVLTSPVREVLGSLRRVLPMPYQIGTDNLTITLGDRLSTRTLYLTTRGIVVPEEWVSMEDQEGVDRKCATRHGEF